MARSLGLDANGAALEQLALEGDPQAFQFTVPMERNTSCDFSYAGLKSAVMRCCEEYEASPATNANRQVHLLYCTVLHEAAPATDVSRQVNVKANLDKWMFDQHIFR